MFVYYTLVLVPGDPLRSYRGNVKSMYVCTDVCMYVYYTVQLVSGDPFPNYRGHLKTLCLVQIICALLRLDSVYCLLLPSGGVP